MVTERLWITIFLSPTFSKDCLAPSIFRIPILGLNLPPNSFTLTLPTSALNLLPTSKLNFPHFSLQFSPPTWLKALWVMFIFPLIINFFCVSHLQHRKTKLEETLIFPAFHFCQLHKLLWKEWNGLDICILMTLNCAISYKKQKLLHQFTVAITFGFK